MHFILVQFNFAQFLLCLLMIINRSLANRSCNFSDSAISSSVDLLNSIKRNQMLSPRGAYVTLLKSRRNPSTQKTRQAYLGRAGALKIKPTNAHDRTSNYKYRSNPKTDRQRATLRSDSNRQSTTRLELRLARGDSKLKTMNSWSKTCISLKPKDQSTHEQQIRKNQQGENCRLVIMSNGKAQQEYFLTVNNLEDVRNYLQRVYPRANHFVTVPRQISLEYMLTKEGVAGGFLNGQSLYLKPEMEEYRKNGNMGIEDFEILKQIGSGGFSTVFLVRNKLDNQFYAMKLIDKEMVVRNKKKKIVMNERNIMVDSKHPFLIELKQAFQAEKYIVFIMEYCAGGQLFGLIKKYRRLSEEVARFYIIEIFLGLAYLHSQNVVYRDIKPENILLGMDGHVKIADLGLAKPGMTDGQLAYSFCGSPEYMSPEMIMQVGHTYPVDYYCMGALLYELLTGLPPFYSQDPNEIYEAVLVEDIVYPEDVQLTTECKSLLKSLLCKDPKHRLGSLYGTKEILAHPWFGKQNYKKYLDKSIEPPINFNSLERIGLDDASDKHRESLEKVLKDQKNEKPYFKDIMKDFYFSPTDLPKRPSSATRDSKRSTKSVSKRGGKENDKVQLQESNRVYGKESERGEKNQDIRRLKKRMTGGMTIRTPLQALIQK